jgi:hypothetical protein
MILVIGTIKQARKQMNHNKLGKQALHQVSQFVALEPIFKIRF